MKNRTWIIVGATSVIAQEFAYLAAQAGSALLLVARDLKQLEIMAADIRLRYQIECSIMTVDFSQDSNELFSLVQSSMNEFDLFIAHSVISNNDELDRTAIANLIQVNITTTAQLIHTYWHKKQTSHRLLFISSVAADRGRAKNSLYGASKAAIEVYLQGLQQAASKNQHITIARLGFIDTKSTYGATGIFYASPPKVCAQACWHASLANKLCFYHPFFWRFIMAIINHLPFFIYKKMGRL